MFVIISFVRYYICYTSSQVCTITMSDKFPVCQKVPYGRNFPFGADFGNAASSMTRPSMPSPCCETLLCTVVAQHVWLKRSSHIKTFPRNISRSTKPPLSIQDFNFSLDMLLIRSLIMGGWLGIREDGLVSGSPPRRAALKQIELSENPQIIFKFNVSKTTLFCSSLCLVMWSGAERCLFLPALRSGGWSGAVRSAQHKYRSGALVKISSAPLHITRHNDEQK